MLNALLSPFFLLCYLFLCYFSLVRSWFSIVAELEDGYWSISNDHNLPIFGWCKTIQLFFMEMEFHFDSSHCQISIQNKGHNSKAFYGPWLLASKLSFQNWADLKIWPSWSIKAISIVLFVNVTFNKGNVVHKKKRSKFKSFWKPNLSEKEQLPLWCHFYFFILVFFFIFLLNLLFLVHNLDTVSLSIRILYFQVNWTM